MTPFQQSDLPWIVDATIPTLDSLRECRRVIGQTTCRDDVDVTLRDEGPYVTCQLKVRDRGPNIDVDVNVHRDLVVDEFTNAANLASFVDSAVHRCLEASLGSPLPPPDQDELILGALMLAEKTVAEGSGPTRLADILASVRPASPLGIGGLHIEDDGTFSGRRWHATSRAPEWCVPGPIRLRSYHSSDADSEHSLTFEIGGDPAAGYSRWIVPLNPLDRLRLEARVAEKRKDRHS